MKTFLIFATIFFSITTNAQSDSTRSAKDYIKQREQTDPNMSGVKRSKLKKSDSLRLINRKNIPVEPCKNKHKP